MQSTRSFRASTFPPHYGRRLANCYKSPLTSSKWGRPRENLSKMETHEWDLQNKINSPASTGNSPIPCKKNGQSCCWLVSKSGCRVGGRCLLLLPFHQSLSPHNHCLQEHSSYQRPTPGWGASMIWWVLFWMRPHGQTTFHLVLVVCHLSSPVTSKIQKAHHHPPFLTFALHLTWNRRAATYVSSWHHEESPSGHFHSILFILFTCSLLILRA